MKALCISMGPDWPLAEEEFKRVGLNVERFDAIVEDNRVLAFNKSVYACMGKARASIADSGSIGDALLLFEDDVMFDTDKFVDFRPFNPFYYSGELPENWVTLHLGANIIGTDLTKWQMPTPFSPHLAKLNNCFQSHATLYSAECVKYILENFKYVTDEYKTEGCMIFDEWLRLNVLSQGRSYLLNPMIAYQRPRHSEIWNVPADYTGAHKQGNEWLKQNL